MFVFMNNVIDFKFCCSILLYFSMLWRVSSSSCASSVSEEIGASVFVVVANKEESIMFHVSLLLLSSSSSSLASVQHNPPALWCLPVNVVVSVKPESQLNPSI